MWSFSHDSTKVTTEWQVPLSHTVLNTHNNDNNDNFVKKPSPKALTVSASVSWFQGDSYIFYSERLTVWFQESRNPQLFLCNAKCLLQVLSVAPGTGSAQIHQVWSQGLKNGQEDHSAPPAGFEVFHVDGTARSEEQSQCPWITFQALVTKMLCSNSKCQISTRSNRL